MGGELDRFVSTGDPSSGPERPAGPISPAALGAPPPMSGPLGGPPLVSPPPASPPLVAPPQPSASPDSLAAPPAVPAPAPPPAVAAHSSWRWAEPAPSPRPHHGRAAGPLLWLGVGLFIGGLVAMAVGLAAGYDPTDLLTRPGGASSP